MHPQRVAALSWPYGNAGTLADAIEADSNSDGFSFAPRPEVNGNNLVYDDGGVEICR
jgi:hypothetical protein